MKEIKITITGIVAAILLFECGSFTAEQELQEEYNQISEKLDDAIYERDNLQAQYETLDNGYTQLQTELTQANEYIERLEYELTQARSHKE